MDSRYCGFDLLSSAEVVYELSGFPDQGIIEVERVLQWIFSLSGTPLSGYLHFLFQL